jgi:hypothetical protein
MAEDQIPQLINTLVSFTKDSPTAAVVQALKDVKQNPVLASSLSSIEQKNPSLFQRLYSEPDPSFSPEEKEELLSLVNGYARSLLVTAEGAVGEREGANTHESAQIAQIRQREIRNSLERKSTALKNQGPTKDKFVSSLMDNFLIQSKRATAEELAQYEKEKELGKQRSDKARQIEEAKKQYAQEIERKGRGFREESALIIAAAPFVDQIEKEVPGRQKATEWIEGLSGDGQSAAINTIFSKEVREYQKQYYYAQDQPVIEDHITYTLKNTELPPEEIPKAVETIALAHPTLLGNNEQVVAATKQAMEAGVPFLAGEPSPASIEIGKALSSQQQLEKMRAGLGESLVELLRVVETNVKKSGQEQSGSSGAQGLLMGMTKITGDVFDSVTADHSKQTEQLLQNNPVFQLLMQYRMKNITKEQFMSLQLLLGGIDGGVMPKNDKELLLLVAAASDHPALSEDKKQLIKEGHDYYSKLQSLKPSKLDRITAAATLLYNLSTDPQGALTQMGIQIAAVGGQWVISKVASGVSLKVGTGAVATLGSKFLVGLATGGLGWIPMLSAGITSGFLSFFRNPKEAAKKMSQAMLLFLIIVGIFIGVIVFLILLLANPAALQQVFTPVAYYGMGEPGGNYGFCKSHPDDSKCGGFCDPKVRDCKWPLGYGCISQGPDAGTHAKSGLSAVDFILDGVNGKPVSTPYAGKVVRAIFKYDDEDHEYGLGGYGNTVWLQMDDGGVLIFGHFNNIQPLVVPVDPKTKQPTGPAVLLTEGLYINADTIIGHVDHTGMSTTPHLHYECRGCDINSYIPKKVPVGCSGIMECGNICLSKS